MSQLENLEEKILFGLTGRNAAEVIAKLGDAEALGIEKAALFLETLSPEEKRKVYERLKDTSIKEFPLVHIRDDMLHSELEFLDRQLKTRYMTMHENQFHLLEEWKGFDKKLFLEMNTDNSMPQNVDMKKIGGFCIDLAYYKVAKEKHAIEYDFVMAHEKTALFGCNHLNGYNPKENRDMHRVERFSILIT